MLLLPVLCAMLAGPPPLPPQRVPILIDTDIGTGIGDAFALALALGSHELDVRGVTAVGSDTKKRAMLLCRFLTMTGRRHVRVAAGDGDQPLRPIIEQEKYHYHPDPLFGRTTRPDSRPAADFLHERLKEQPGRVTLVALGPLTNAARLLDKHPDAARLLRRIVYLEKNAALDKIAMRKVTASGVNLLAVPASVAPRLNATGVKRVFAPRTPLTRQVETLYQMWDKENPPLAKSFAVASCITAVDAKRFSAWYADRMASLVAPGSKPSRFVAQGGLPLRVHVAEDFDNDIERTWWMSGKPETKLLPSGSKRACRAVLTHDFDDLLMVSRKMYKAVIFNPVPGPPMGNRPRLSFRYWIKGSDTLRVQLYSLTNGYHRQLVVTKLPQGEWRHGTVDMTQARRADGTGGALGQDERIDDIQFYADPDAELLIDDIVLYDAAPPDEKHPFPKRIIWAGGFDTGTKARHWPGEFDIVTGGAFWKAARSVPDASGKPWIRMGLRGKRALGRKANLSFRYQLKGADAFVVELAGAQARVKAAPGWTRTTVTFSPKKTSTDEIRFRLTRGAELVIDDVLLHE